VKGGGKMVVAAAGHVATACMSCSSGCLQHTMQAQRGCRQQRGTQQASGASMQRSACAASMQSFPGSPGGPRRRWGGSPPVVEGRGGGAVSALGAQL
jgi:hypothetical protein